MFGIMSALSEIRLPIPWQEVDPSSIEPTLKALVSTVREEADAVAKEAATATPQRTLERLDLLTETLEYAMGLVSHLESTMTTDAIRAAFGAVQEPVANLYTELGSHRGLYDALGKLAGSDGAVSTPSSIALEPVWKRFAEKTRLEMKRNGAELGAEGRSELSRIDAALAKTTLAFAQNVLDSENAWAIIVPEARLDGVPPAVKARMKERAAQKGNGEENAASDAYLVTLDAPTYLPIMTYAHDRELRREIYRANVTRATEPGRDNRPLIVEVLQLRQARAKLLGFDTFADLVLCDRMAKDVPTTKTFLAGLRERLAPAFRRENAELESFAKEKGAPLPLAPWDASYWSEKLRKERFDFDDEILRPYFPSTHVVSGLFAVAQSLYGVSIAETRDMPTWHESVRAFVVNDERGQRIGAFYMDLYPRSTKRQGAWMAGFVDGLFGTASARENVAVIVANNTPPGADGVALFSHREVETLFHEFGHAMHHLVCRAQVRSLSGTRVAQDFVELPSMIMENWCWEPESLAMFAKHHESSQPIPEALVEKMRRARTFRAANAMMRQVGFSHVDMWLHTQFDPNASPQTAADDVMSGALQVFGEFSSVPLPDDYAMIASFSHLFGGSYGYAAGYYSYQWSESLAAHAFALFKEKGVLDRSTGMRFMSEILSRGETDAPAQLYRNFRGTDHDVEPLLERLGVSG